MKPTCRMWAEIEADKAYKLIGRSGRDYYPPTNEFVFQHIESGRYFACIVFEENDIRWAEVWPETVTKTLWHDKSKSITTTVYRGKK